MNRTSGAPAAENVVATLYGVGDLRIETRPLPELGERDVLVAIQSVGVCGSDMHYYEHGRIGSLVVDSPLVLGHEASGVVVQRGERACRHELGQRVAIEPGAPCGRCRECRSGSYNLCRDVRFFGTPPTDGAFGRFVAVHEDFAFALPDNLSDDAGALLEPLSVGVWSCKKGGVGLGDRVLVTGAGPIGNLAAQVAWAAGAAELAVADVNVDRLERIPGRPQVRMVAVGESSIEGEFDVLIECTGDPDLTAVAVSTLRPAGTAVLVGASPAGELELPLDVVRRRELTIVGDLRYANTYPTAIALASSGRIELDSLVDARYPLEETERALRATRESPNLLKVMLHIGAGA